MVLQVTGLEQEADSEEREPFSLVWCNGTILDQCGDCGEQVFYDLAFANELAAHIVIQLGGCVWTDAAGNEEKVEVFRYPPSGWELGWFSAHNTPCYWKRSTAEVRFT